jgi:exoribonuclease R
MFPRELSEDKMSLKPGQRRAAIVLEWDWVQGHGITHMELHERDVIVNGS